MKATGGTTFHTFEGVGEYDPVLPQPTAAVPDGKAAICDGGERAPANWKRFRVRGNVPCMPLPARYIIAKTQADAEAAYLEGEGLTDVKLAVSVMPD